MISLSSAGASVGPHYDFYDVFLVQGHGTKLWHYDLTPLSARQQANIQKNQPLRLLNRHKFQRTVTMKPGDVLYIPPGVAHWGIAESPLCMTYSVGFRAPKLYDLALAWLEELPPEADDLYSDPDLKSHKRSYEITADDQKRLLKQLVQKLSADSGALARAMGRCFTAPGCEDQPEGPAPKLQAIERAFMRGKRLRPWPGLKMAYSERGEHLFIEGQCFVFKNSRDQSLVRRFPTTIGWDQKFFAASGIDREAWLGLIQNGIKKNWFYFA